MRQVHNIMYFILYMYKYNGNWYTHIIVILKPLKLLKLNKRKNYALDLFRIAVILVTLEITLRVDEKKRDL